MFGGIDWASEEHAVCVLDDIGKKLSSFSVEHSADGLEELVKRLRSLGAPEELPIAIERPDGRLVDRLLEAGHSVVPVSPNAIKTWREAEVISGAKSDPGDAQVIAEYLRIRFHQLDLLTPFSEATKALRALVRARDSLVKQRTASHNQLEATLDLFWPGAKNLFSDVTREIALVFLETYPTPSSAEGLDEEAMVSFCTQHSYGHSSPQELINRLRQAPAGIPEGPEAKARGEVVLALVQVIRGLNASIKDLESSIAAQLGEHPDSEVFTSLPYSGVINAAQMLAEWGDCRKAYDSADSVSALAGMSPVTKKSGKYKSVSFRWACNKRFRKAMTTFASNSRRGSAWAAKIYDDARARGHTHQHAVRVLARAWIRVIFRCWLDGVPYDPDKHKAAAVPASDTSPKTKAA